MCREAQLVQCLTCKPEDLSLISMPHVKKKVDMVVANTCNPSAGEMGTDRPLGSLAD